MAYSSGLTPLPPTVHHSSEPVTHSSAYAILSSFLSVAELDPSLRPDSVLSERGPTSSSSAANPNLTLAHLGRIAKGMRGERVGGGADDGDLNDVGLGGNLWGARKRKRTEQQPETPREGEKGLEAATQNVEIVEDGSDAGEPALVSTSLARDEDGWQDRENYDLAQDDDEVDVGNVQRNPGVSTRVEGAIGTEEPEGEAVDARVADPRTTGEEREEEERGQRVVHENKVDKAERKRLKKERSKKEKKTARAR
jgi:hypothetical protein